MNISQDIQKFIPFLNYVKEWENRLKTTNIKELIREAGAAKNIALFSVDLLKGFCSKGPLASPRIAKIVAPVSQFLQNAYQAGIRNFIFIHDCHPPTSLEFKQFGPHCIQGTEEAEMVEEFKKLPFSSEFTIINKRSISSNIETELDTWMDTHCRNLKKIIVVGDCTDLCLYQLAMYLKLKANAQNLEYEVIVPADCVQTYDLPVEEAKKLNILPHDGDLFHLIFLYHMQLNGISIVRGIEP